MTATQLRKSLERSGRTVRGAAQEMQIHERTVHKYLSGELQIPKLVELVALCWLEHPAALQSTDANVISIHAARTHHDVTVRRLTRGTIEIRISKDGDRIFSLESDDVGAKKLAEALNQICAVNQTGAK